ncbi:MAG: AI-2E family transporter [Coxiellaceae bacterium]|jgi:putative permease|nr:AI-2E family transporter [Coxiellaceae bacterium]
MNKIITTWFKRYLSHPEAITIVIICISFLIVFKIMEQILVPIILSIVITYLLFGLLKQLERWHCPHLLALSVVFLLFISLLLLALLWLLPMLWEETIGLITEIPTLLREMKIMILELHNYLPDLIPISLVEQVVTNIISCLANFSKEIVVFSLASLFGIVTVIIYLILVPLLVFFFLKDGQNIISWMTSFLPQKRQILREVCGEMHEKIHRYILGKIIEIVIIAVSTIAIFEFLGLRYAVLLGALVGLSVMIPYIGITIVTIPIVIVGIMQWGITEHFCYVMIAHIVISVLDANFLVPMLFSEIMNLHPLEIILSVLVFGNLLGFWGVFFAIPLMTLANVVMKSWPKENSND